jgi:hypothetical protein
MKKTVIIGTTSAAMALLVALLSSLVVKSPTQATAASIIIAASNSTYEWKLAATVVCTGTDDQNTINNYLTSGNTVELTPGIFNIDGLIILTSRDSLSGQGDTTILNMVDNNGEIYSDGVNNVTVSNLEIAGKEYPSGGIFIGDGGKAADGVYVHDITDTALGGDDFVIYANKGTVSNISFVRCNASNPDGMGFMVNGAGSPSNVTNVTFFLCKVENAGVASTRGSPWVTGFGLCEYAGLTVNSEYVIDCYVSGSWESAFHYEVAPKKINCVVVGSSAADAGLKPAGFNNRDGTYGLQYGAGYLVDGKSDTILYNNSASLNSVADIRAWNGSKYVNVTAVANKVYPSSSIKTDSGVFQGNCSGVIINTDSTHKELILYSTDGNPVNQQIALGGYYASNDGNTYTFNGSNLVAQFTNYAVIKLVKLNRPALSITTNSFPNGTKKIALKARVYSFGWIGTFSWLLTCSLPRIFTKLSNFSN